MRITAIIEDVIKILTQESKNIMSDIVDHDLGIKPDLNKSDLVEQWNDNYIRIQCLKAVLNGTNASSVVNKFKGTSCPKE